MQEYLREAFTQLNLLEADFDLTADADKVDELKAFVADDVDEPVEEEIIDVEAETEKDLENTYAGKVILECECCHSRIYKNIRDVVIDKETELANIDEECPVCNCALGWTVIGKIEKFNPDDIPEEPEEKEEVELDLKGAQVELDATEPVEESLNESWVKEWWGQDLSEVDTLTKEYGLVAKKLDTKGDETLIKFVGPREKIKAAMNGGYFYSLGYPESGAECSDDLAIHEVSDDINEECESCEDDIQVEEKCNESCDKLEEKLTTDDKRNALITLYDESEIARDNIDALIEEHCTYSGQEEDVYDGNDIEYLKNSTINKIYRDMVNFFQFEFETHGLENGDVDETIVKVLNLKESCDKLEEETCEECNESLQEDFKEVEIKTDDQKLEMTSDENGKVTVTTEPLTEEDQLPPDDIEVTDYDTEEIVPLSDSEEEQIETNSEEEVEEEPVEEVEETEEEVTEEEPTEEESEGEEVEEIAEESFDYLANNFMKRTYHNVDNYKTTSVRESGNQLVVEGLITFNSGATKKTTFKFEPELLNNKQVRLRGLNETFSNRKNTFNVRCSIQDKKLIAESMRYNYITKDKLNESVQIKGREVKKNK